MDEPSADGDLTAEQRDRLLAVEEFCAEHCSGEELRRLTSDHTDPHSDEIASLMAERGWWGLTIEEQHGGSAGSFLDAATFIETTAYAEAPIAAFLSTFIVVAALQRFGSDAQKSELLERVVGGGVLAIAVSEPEAGSDFASLTASARRDNGDWVLSGEKRWCSYAHRASHILIVCRTDDGGGKHEGISMIFVPREAEGLTITPISTLGGDKVTNALQLDQVRVPADALLGTEGEGWTQAVAGLNAERVAVAANSLGLAQRAFDEALAYAREREQFDRPIGSFQAIQHSFAELATELVQVRLLVRWVARLADEESERLLPKEASMAKLAATELAKRCALEGMQLMGAAGYSTEHPMERYMRSALAATIFGGTAQIQKNIIARTLGL